MVERKGAFWKEKIVVFSVLLPIFIINSILFGQKTNLFSEDLGRHLKNGEIILKNKDVIGSNFYSYTYSQYSTINHHWASGPIFYLVYQAFGFLGLSLFHLFLINLTLFFILLSAMKKSSLMALSFTVPIFLPLLSSRAEIRPETFSLLFFSIFLYLLIRFEDLKKPKIIFFLAVLQVLWVNLHVYFFLGPLTVGCYLVKEAILLIQRKNNHFKILLSVFLLVSFACLANPRFLWGALYPLIINNQMAYRVLELQSPLFLLKIIPYPLFYYFLPAFILIAASFVLLIVSRKISLTNLPLLLLFIFFSFLSFQAVRNFSFFGLLGILVFSVNLAPFLPKNLPTNNYFYLPFYFLIISFLLFLMNPAFFLNRNYGFGLLPKTEEAAVFFQKNKLQGPILNNFEIGSYLIFHFFPREKVFIDGRPEAYPADFFQKIYIPLQEDEKTFQKYSQKYNFQTVFFYRHDLTPWAQNFLIRMVSNRDWAPVFVDDYAIIFVKRGKVNEQIISRFEIPKTVFNVSEVK